MNYRDYSKFKLKNESELAALLGRTGDRDLFVLSCNKCFKVYTSDSLPEPEADDFVKIAEKHKKTVKDTIQVDFLCNEHRMRKCLEKMFASPSLPSALFVISCGIGTQTLAGLAYDMGLDIPVFTACDSVREGGGHGMSLTDKRCGACAQCFLNATGAFCPITGCAKQLLNGACGGARDGKCEVDSNTDCVWEKIELSLNSREVLGDHVARVGEDSNVHLNACSVLGVQREHYQCFAHNRVVWAQIGELSSDILNRRLESFYGGIYLRYNKSGTDFLTLQELSPPPCKIILPMSQHAGMSAEPIVRVGERVLLGQKIGEAVGTLSSCVHSSVSGYVREIAYKCHPNVKGDVLCVTIESDGKDELHPSVKPIPYWEDLDLFDIDAIIAEKGIVGMGGAGFPTPVKLKSPKPIDTILINGCESEPYITADHRIMLEKPDDIINGLQIIMKSTGALRAIIVISDNKSDAIKLLEAKTESYDDIFVMALWSKYPQGAERMLIARALGRYLDYGQRPYDVGAIVINASTARAIGDAFTRGMPLIERAVTVSGENVQHPGNFMVRIGTPVSDLLNRCSIGSADDNTHIRFGGPMMGVVVSDLSTPVIKGTNAVLSLNNPISCSLDCIRCGRCVDVCPMELLPLHFPIIVKTNFGENGADMPHSLPQETNPRNCIECGACDYICPSGIEIRKAIRELKERLLCFTQN